MADCYRSPTTCKMLLGAAKTSDFSGLTSLRASLGTSYSQRDNFRGQRRSMFIQTQSTPNPASLMFYPGKPLMDTGSADFPNARTAMSSPLAKNLFGIDGLLINPLEFSSCVSILWKLSSLLPIEFHGNGSCHGNVCESVQAAEMRHFTAQVHGCRIRLIDSRTLSLKPAYKEYVFKNLDKRTVNAVWSFVTLGAGITRVFFGTDFVTVTKSEDSSWDFLKPEIFAAIMDFYSSEQPLFLDSNTAASMDTAIHEDDSETVAMIKELLETRIRPAVQDDGGDIGFVRFDPDTGIVKLRMQGACSGCPSSSVTLKSGIENMLMHYVPEVKGVEQELDAEDGDAALTGAPYE
ncbi:UNVERIFIED_CONTAM: NifU-like protein 4, mitochondrial [Sesamum indicum]